MQEIPIKVIMPARAICPYDNIANELFKRPLQGIGLTSPEWLFAVDFFGKLNKRHGIESAGHPIIMLDCTMTSG